MSNSNNAENKGQILKSVVRSDGYINAITKYGTKKDSTTMYRFQAEMPPDDRELAELYIANGLFAKVVDIPSDDAVRKGFSLGIKDEMLENSVFSKLEEIGWEVQAAKALSWSRLYGGAIVVMIVDDGGLLQDKLNWSDARKVEELLVYGRDMITPLWMDAYDYKNNPGSPYYKKGNAGKPTHYQVSDTYSSFVVHESRCLVFSNGTIPESSLLATYYRGWGIPEYLKIKAELQQTVTNFGYAARLLERCSMAVYKMQGLSDLVSTDSGTDDVLARLEVIDMARNLLNTAVIDADGEELDFKSNMSVSGIKDVLDAACTMLSAVTNIPQTLLFGRSPAGENATGESDLENYYSYIEKIQSRIVKNNLKRLLELVFRELLFNGKIKEIPEYTIEFNSLWNLSDNEKADRDLKEAQIQLTKAQVVAQYITAGIYDERTVQRSLVEDEIFNPENILRKEDLTDDWGLTMPTQSPTKPQNEVLTKSDMDVDQTDETPTDGENGDNLMNTDSSEEIGFAAAIVFDDEYRILCGYRDDGGGWCGGGGHIEQGETPEQAMIRELFEEFGIVAKRYTALGTSDGLPTESQVCMNYAVFGYEGNPKADNDEMHNAAWFTPEQIVNEEVPGGKVFAPFKGAVEKFILNMK